MADTVTVRIDAEDLGAIMRDLNLNVDKMLALLAADLSALAKTFAPVDTGALRASLDFEKVSDKLYTVSDAVSYGIYQEYGTSTMPAQPFMVPATESVGNRAREYAKGIVDA